MNRTTRLLPGALLLGALAAAALGAMAGTDADPSAGDATRTSTSTTQLSVADLDRILPPADLLERRWGTQLDTTESRELSQLWEGMDQRRLGLAGGRTRFYRHPAGRPVGGYVALSLFDSVQDAKAFLATNPSYDPTQEAGTDGFGEVYEVPAADEGRGWTLTEDGGDVFGGAVARMDRMVVEVALFGQPEAEYRSDVTAVAAAVREGLTAASR
jgi:hypothetical protein